MNKVQIISAMVTLVFASAVSATVVSGDFRSEVDLPFYGFGDGPLTYQEIGATVGAGFELTEADFLENPEGWNGGLVYVDYDPTTNILLFDSQDTWDFQNYELWITNIAFDSAEVITGLTLLSDDLTTVGVPSYSFTDNSIHIRWDEAVFADTFNFTGNTAEFQVTLSPSSAPVPEPATLSLLGMGVLGLVARARKSKKQA